MNKRRNWTAAADTEDCKGGISGGRQMTEEQERTECRKKALHILERMDRTEAELKEKLLEREFSTEAVEDAIEYVRSYGYIDDARYAVHYVSYQKQFKSIRRMQYELQKKGIREDLAEAALEDAASSGETELIEKIIRKRIPDTENVDRKTVEKCKAYLYRQGFRMTDIISCVEKCGLTEL